MPWTAENYRAACQRIIDGPVLRIFQQLVIRIQESNGNITRGQTERQTEGGQCGHETSTFFKYYLWTQNITLFWQRRFHTWQPLRNLKVRFYSVDELWSSAERVSRDQTIIVSMYIALGFPLANETQSIFFLTADWWLRHEAEYHGASQRSVWSNGSKHSSDAAMSEVWTAWTDYWYATR